ncbi:MAG: diguanylate cyclase domain-containing protein [Thiogranum sp.]
MTESCTGKPVVLVVDDSRLMRLAARKILKSDFEIIEAEDGEAAWDRLQENSRITLVMSDLSMPNLDGLGLLKRIRESSQPELKELPVIIVTGAEDDDGSKKTAFSAGASDFITKPFESVQLLARAQTHAKQEHTRQALQHSETSKQQLEKHTSIDLTTGLPNQRAFTDNIAEQLSYANRHNTGIALLLIQVDKYKILFLRQGKQTAENILQRITQILGAGRRREDTVARINLDTFGILLPSATPEGAGQVARQLHRAIGEQSFANNRGESLRVKVSVAVAAPTLHAGLDAAQLLTDAGKALQQAQAAGGDCVQGAELQTPPEPHATADKAPVVPASPAPAATAVAGAEELLQALRTLADGGRPETDAEALVRAVLPLLDNWNRHNDERYTPLLEQLKSTLDPVAGDTGTATLDSAAR